MFFRFKGKHFQSTKKKSQEAIMKPLPFWEVLQHVTRKTKEAGLHFQEKRKLLRMNRRRKGMRKELEF